MAIQTHTKNKLDLSTDDRIATELETKIASNAALTADAIQKLTYQVADQNVAKALIAGVASGSAISSAAANDAQYSKAVYALAMMMGSFDAARDLLAHP